MDSTSDALPCPIYDREKQEIERKFREQIDTLSTRVSELDVENRKLREAKYDLDSKVRGLGLWVNPWQEGTTNADGTMGVIVTGSHHYDGRII